jgi:hypothetical protein
MDVSVGMVWNGISSIQRQLSSIQFISLALEKYKLNFKRHICNVSYVLLS